MKLLRIACVIALSVLILHAEDRQFSLSAFGIGPITLHTTLTHEGDGERLIATARNESGTAIQRAKICIRAFESASECLFELSNTALWAPGGELNWSLTTAKKVAALPHYATFEQLDVAKAQEAVRPPDVTPSAAVARSPLAPPAPPAKKGKTSKNTDPDWKTGKVLDSESIKSTAYSTSVFRSIFVQNTQLVIAGEEFAYVINDRKQGGFPNVSGAVINAVENRRHGCRFIVNDQVRFYQDKATLHVIDADGKECQTDIVRQERLAQPVPPSKP